MSPVEQYWSGVAQRLQVEVDIFNRLIGHNGEMGRANELALAELLKSLLPTSVGIGTGVVIDSSGSRSAQSDLIVYDRNLQPQLLAQSTQLLFPIETVLAVIEVKTTVDERAVLDVGEKGLLIRNLVDSRPGGLSPVYGLFGYQVAGSAATIARSVLKLDQKRQPDLVCIVRPGVLGKREKSMEMHLVPLHERVGESRKSGEWAKPVESKGAQTTIGGSIYPVSRFEPNGATRYVFEPGRALLLFCNQLLLELEARGVAGRNWLMNYLPDVARETVPVTLPKTKEAD